MQIDWSYNVTESFNFPKSKATKNIKGTPRIIEQDVHYIIET